MPNVGRTLYDSYYVSSSLLGIPCVTDCVMAELEKLGHRYRVALR